jgi:hypothetical protein
MVLTASKLRSDIYRILDRVLETGQAIEVQRKGRRVRIVPVDPPTRLARLRTRDLLTDDNPDAIVHLDWSGEWRP